MIKARVCMLILIAPIIRLFELLSGCLFQETKPARKTPVTLAEAKRERQKQYRQMKEDRRSTISQASGIDSNQITEMLLGDSKDWGGLGKHPVHSPDVEEFFIGVKRYLDALSSARENMDDKIDLSTGEESSLVAQLSNTNDLQNVLTSSESMERLNRLVQRWGNEIEKLLNQSEQVRRESDNIGPSVELAYWRARMVRFTNLIDEMRTPPVHTVITTLYLTKARITNYWRELDNRITAAANEAKDNVKYLSTLDTFFGSFANANPSKLAQQLPTLLNAIRMIYSVSQHYNTSERVTSLFIKVTNQLIVACRRYVTEGVSRIWDLPNENYIFGKFDVYSTRLNKLVHILDLVDKFTVLTTLKIEGIEGIVARYKTLCDNLKKKNFDGADQMKKEVERQLDILEKFQQLEFCNLDLASKYALVMKNYAHELDSIRNLYEQQKTDPPVIRNMTPIAGKIYWARHLFKLIDNPMQQFKRRCSDVLWTTDGQKCVRQFNKIAAALVEFELLYHHHWCQSIEQVNTGLSSSLLVRDLTTGKLFVNFDLGILELIYETRYLRVLGLTIPAAAQRLLIQEPKFKQRYYT
ncbi:hypothetical protein PHET_04380 [Paragonimus heterotremus]|uniref:Dynein heavy chain tail domain-containing protein n=1 Tax=Paragonimus heterotremus TaxID=100268 RepID=A0A8J4WS12_9TREM|nr:hypothetical protein PHET_04380 [Paragonimus heterotremus]